MKLLWFLPFALLAVAADPTLSSEDRTKYDNWQLKRDNIQLGAKEALRVEVERVTKAIEKKRDDMLVKLNQEYTAWATQTCSTAKVKEADCDKWLADQTKPKQ